ncbi:MULTISPECIES: hypothetical protein [Fischerella]|nr:MULTISPECIES: hypothetical protein [Fischerella]
MTRLVTTNNPSGSPVPHRDGDRLFGGLVSPTTNKQQMTIDQ